MNRSERRRNMKAVQLDGEQRLRIVNILGQQTGVLSQLKVWGRVIDKLELNPEEQSTMEVSINNGNIKWNSEKVVPLVKINLEDEEYRTMKGILETYTNFSNSDRRWLDPVMEEVRRIDESQTN